jgi:hypothetical protein
MTKKVHILKHGSYYNLVMTKPADQEMTVIEKMLLYSKIKRGGPCHTMGSHTEKHQNQLGGKGRGRKYGKSCSVVFDGTGRHWQASFQLVNSNNSRWPWGIDTVTWCDQSR